MAFGCYMPPAYKLLPCINRNRLYWVLETDKNVSRPLNHRHRNLRPKTDEICQMTKNAVFFVKAEQGKQRLGKQGKSGVKLGAKLCLAHFRLVFLLGLTIYLLFISRLLGQNIVLLEFSKVLVYFWRVKEKQLFCMLIGQMRIMEIWLT